MARYLQILGCFSLGSAFKCMLYGNFDSKLPKKHFYFLFPDFFFELAVLKNMFIPVLDAGMIIHRIC